MAAVLGASLAEHEEREFEDGEHKARPLVSVRGRDVYVIHSLHGGPGQGANDKICRLLFFLATIREGGAARVTAVIPYLAYARKDRQTKSRDPVTTRYMAQLLEAMGVDAVVTLDVHNIVAFQRVPGRGRHPLSLRAYVVSNFNTQHRTVLYYTSTPRSARRSSTSRTLSGNRKYNKTACWIISGGKRCRQYEMVHISD